MWVNAADVSCRNEVVINRIRLGHTFVTHGDLLGEGG